MRKMGCNLSAFLFPQGPHFSILAVATFILEYVIEKKNENFF
jgi:hypothetical protein